MTRKILSVSLICTALLAACAPVTASPQGSMREIGQENAYARELAFRQKTNDNDRLFNISFPILAANAEFCEKTTAGFGMTAWNLDTQAKEFRATAKKLYNLQDRLAVQFVADKSPAARAGIQSGDFIVAINGTEIPPGTAATKTVDQVIKTSGGKPLSMRLERNGKQFNTTVKPVTVCNYPVYLDYNSGEVNAYADGSKIVISRGILRFSQNDNEVALVVAHELAHNAMGHIDKKITNAMMGTLGGMLIDAILASQGVNSGGQFGGAGQQIGGGAYSVEFEQEADYVGMYFMERGGYNSRNVGDFWRRMAADNPSGISNATTHPTSPSRFIAIDKTYQEIAAKKAKGQKLAPNLKEKN